MFSNACAAWRVLPSLSPPVCTRGHRRLERARRKDRGDRPWVAAKDPPPPSPTCRSPARPAEKESADAEWLATLRDARIRHVGNLKCDARSRPDPSRGVRPVKPYWRRGESSSYDEADGDVVADVSKAVSGAMASIASSRNTEHHIRTNLRRAHRRRHRSGRDDEDEAFGTAADGLRSARASVAGADDRHHPVLRALMERKRGGSKPGARSDGLKIGLAVEGGGMRGVVSAGAVGEVLRMGFADCFDAVYGSSAGAMNLTYYLAKQPEGVAAYQEDLVGGEFLSLKRMTAKAKTQTAPAMDVSYLVDGVMDGVTNRALAWDRVIHSPVPLKVVATSLDTLTPVVLEGPYADVEDLKQCLKASAAVPVFAGAEPVVHRGQRLVDAAVMEPVPVHAAAADGCTHVLVLCTRELPLPGTVGASRVAATVDREGAMAAGAAVDASERPQWNVAAVSGRWEAGVMGGPSGSGAASSAGMNGGGQHWPGNGRRERMSKVLTSALHKTIRSALLSPPHMKHAWGVADAADSLVYDQETPDLDNALVLARDDPVAAAAISLFPGGAHVFPVSPLPAVLPKGLSSICTDSKALKEGNEAGVKATNEVLSRVLAWLEGEEEVSYYIETMSARDFM